MAGQFEKIIQSACLKVADDRPDIFSLVCLSAKRQANNDKAIIRYKFVFITDNNGSKKKIRLTAISTSRYHPPVMCDKH